MITPEVLAAAMRGATRRDPASDALLEAMASTLARLITGEISAEAATAQLATAGPALRELDGKKVEAGGKLLDFSSAVAGSITVGDVAGGNLTRVVVNLGPPLDIGEASPSYDVELWLVGRLPSDHIASLIDIARRTLHVEVPPGIDPSHVIARALMTATIPALTEFVRLMANLDCPNALQVSDVAGPFCWVKPEAAALIPTIAARPPRQRGFSINSSLSQAALHYLACAPMPRFGPVRAGLSGRNTDGPLAALVGEIYSVLAVPLRCTVEQCPAKLAATTRPIFVVLPGEPVDADLLEDLREAFPMITFVILAGTRDPAEFAELHLDYVDYLEPALQPGEDALATASLEEIRDFIFCEPG